MRHESQLHVIDGPQKFQLHVIDWSKISITCNFGAKKFQLHVIEWLKITITVVYKRHSEWYSM